MSRHQYRTVVKRVHPHAWRWRLLAASVLLSGCVAAGVWWGQHIAGAPALLTDQNAALQDQINQLHLQAEVDQQTLNELRDDLRQRAADVAALGDMLAFYRSVLAPEDADVPVVIRQEKSTVGECASSVLVWRRQCHPAHPSLSRLAVA